ncbi:hypothetical protein DVT68_08605 [Dyella solisilvae]|uniref:Uncharacterized protein n=1 Tax=Dyella solisilvae TaxID=1920168 RepID=A0A370K7F0_9GAMM|nr:hypothetical protein DVT68_08605 [Dyella solisilvae]
MALGSWLLALGSWLLALGSWLLTSPPLWRERAGGGIARRVAGMDAGQWIVRAGRPVDPPRLLTAPPQGRAIGVAFLLVTSLWPRKEK